MYCTYIIVTCRHVYMYKKMHAATLGYLLNKVVKLKNLLRMFILGHEDSIIISRS